MANDQTTNEAPTNQRPTNEGAAAGTERRPTVADGSLEPTLRAADPWRALFEEWFITYNPLPLASAALVLFGLWVVSREIARLGVAGAVGVAGIAELYALSLVAGAWVLRTRGHRRAAVMLGLLAALYQCDVTLHFETCAYLGTIGALASIAWVALFALKLDLLARALELELSRPARWLPIAAAATLAVLPHEYRSLSPDARGVLVAIALYAIGATALSCSREVRARHGFDVRGRRAVLGVQWLFAAAALSHVAYACAAMRVPGTPVAIAIAFVSLRLVRSEAHLWAAALLLVLATALLAPDAAPVAALLAAAALALHAVRVRAPEEAAPPEIVTNSMYRGAPADPLTSEEISLLAARPIVFVRAETDAQLRLTLGALALTHVGLTGLASESAPSLLATHELLLDVGLAFLTLALLVRTRRAWSLTPLALGLVHLAVVEGWLVWPRDALELGVWAISLGFSTLGISVALSVHHVPSRSAPEVGSWDRLLDREADASRNAGATNAAAGGGGVLTRPS